jgi:hypothetical protein
VHLWEGILYALINGFNTGEELKMWEGWHIIAGVKNPGWSTPANR